MWKEDWTPRSQALAYQELVYNDLWTQITDKADNMGNFITAAFYSDYIIISNGESKKDKSIQILFK